MKLLTDSERYDLMVAATDIGMLPGPFDPEARAEYEYICELDAIQRSEIEAENGWLRAAEAPTAEDYAFERWESDMGLT